MNLININSDEQKLNDYYKAAREEDSLLSAEEMISNIENSPILTLAKDSLFHKLGKLKMIIGASSLAILITALSVFFTNNEAQLADNANEKENIAVMQSVNENVKIDTHTDQPQANYRSNSSEIETSVETTPIKKEKKKKNSIIDGSINEMIENLKIDVGGVKHIELSPEKINELGIDINEGSISIIAGKDRFTKYTILAEGGVQIEKLKDNDINIGLTPRLVSSIYGDKRLAMFYNDSVNISISKSVMKDDDIESVEYKYNRNDTIPSIIYHKKSEKNNDIQDTNRVSKSFKYSKTLEPKDSLVLMNFAKAMEESDGKNFKFDFDMDSTKSLVELIKDVYSTINIIANQQISSNNTTNDTNFSHDSIKFIPDEMALKLDLADLSDCNLAVDLMIDINKLIPVAVACPTKDDPDFKFLVWFEVTPEFLDVLPEDIRNTLNIELEAAEKGSYCEMPETGGDLYFDVWRSCDGAIEQMNIFPNPVQNVVNVDFILKEEREIIVNLHDLNGNKIANLQASKLFNQGNQELSFDFSDYAAGMYLIVLYTSDGEKAVQRVIKN